ncbi:unnamed protein product [Closterium sp. NIES-53]
MHNGASRANHLRAPASVRTAVFYGATLDSHSAAALAHLVLPTKLLRGMELQEAAEEEGEGEAEAVGEALAEGEAEVTTMRGMGALVKPPGKIRFVAAASGALLPVIGVGNAKVMGTNGRLVGLGNVLLVEGLSANLLSVRRLQKSKAKVTFDPTSCCANLGKLLLWNLEEKSSCTKDLWQLPIIPWNGKPPATAAAAATAKATAGGEEIAPTDGALDAVKKVQQPQQPHGEVLAGVDVTAAWAKASSGSGEADWETWHERLCHVNFSMLQKLVKDGSLKGLEVKGAAKEVGSCPTCLETKFTKFPFSSGMGPAKAPLALVHMDVVGPTRAPSLSGSRYFLTIVDDHTRAVWVYPLQTKGEVAAAVIKEWMPRAQRESGHKVKVIRTDNGGGFIGADFEAVLKKKGIQHQLTVPYNPQQNGVAERFNRTLQEGAGTLLGRAGLPDPFWVTALRQIALVKNRVLATVGDKQWVPYTKWYGSAPAVNMLRAYDCMVVFHVPKEKRGKLEASGRWGVQRPSRQVQVTVLDEEISGVTEDGGEHEVVRAGSVAEQCDEDEIAHCYWAAVPEPKTLAEALSGPDAEKWKQSVKEEYDSLLENEAWELCELPPGKKAMSSKLIFRHKYGPDGELTRYKSRLVAKGFQQTKGKDFDEIFPHVGKGTTLRVMLGTAANHGWRIKQMDITTAFLNGIILEELYMLQLEGLDDGSGRVCKLKKAIYGLNQAPRAWYHKLEETPLAGGFKKSECDHSLFLLQEKEQFLMLLVYVDDILLFSESSAMIERVEEMLEMQFKCLKMGDVKYFLGMHVERDLDKGVLRLHQRKYCEGLAEKYGLQDGGKPATPLPSDFTVEPCADEELEAAKRLVRYVSATASVGLEYSAVRQRLQRGAADLSKGEMLLTCHTDASFNSVKADGTSIGGYVCLFGGGAVSWRSKKQNEVGLSSCETEYMALHAKLFLRTDTLLPPFYFLVYVNDLVIATADTEALALVKSELQKRHTCTDLGELRSYLGLQITRDRARRTITLTQSHMVHQVLQRFGFQFSSPQPTRLSTSHSLSAPPSDEFVEPSGPYPELVGCLITSGMGLVLGGWGPVVLVGHADASGVDDSATQPSSQGYTFSLGSGSVSWRSTRSSLVLSSSCEAEIYAGAMAAQELRWLTYLLTDLGEQPRSPPQRGQPRLAYVATRANTADVFTKALPPGDHQRFATVLDLVPTLPHLLTA